MNQQSLWSWAIFAQSKFPNPDDIKDLILSQLDPAGLGHNTYIDDAIALIVHFS